MDKRIETTSSQQLEEREKFIMAFNKTMVNIWKERITLMGVIDTGTLLDSVVGVKCNADGKFLQIELSQAFRTYGLWQDTGVGRETARGNGGDIGREKKRQKRPWFSKKYYASVMNLNEFMADNVGKSFIGIVSDIFDTTKLARANW